MPRARRPATYSPILSAVEQAAVEGLQASGKTVLRRSNELVPERTGKLKRSGRVVTDFLTVIVRYTNPIAWIVHEKLDLRHEKGQAKFLETALRETDVGEKIASAISVRLTGKRR